LPFLSPAPNHLPLGLPTGFLPSVYSFIAFFTPFHTSSSSHDPPIGVLSVRHYWLPPFPCIVHKFRHFTCSAIVH
jgi:hypothetical protein